jgi:predicted dienelactone hydrolase
MVTRFVTRLLPLLTLVPAWAAKPPYDPLKVPDRQVRTLELEFTDTSRKRDLPVLVYLPEAGEPAPVVLFSHGLGGTRHGSSYLGRHWALRGYVAVFVQHPGSDDSAWRGTPLMQRMQAMNRAASGANFALRVKDIPAVLDQLARWNAEKGHPLHGRLDLKRVGMSGHSFGAMTTQAVSGQSFGLAGPIYTDRRIKAAIAFSPSSPRVGDASRAFASVRIPWMLMTGTRDTAPIGNATVESRLKVFPALPPGDKYELVLHDAEHSAFTDRALPGDRVRRNPNHHRAILALSTAFWDAYLRDDPEAKRWLTGDAPRTVLEPKDRWQRK